ncbi:MAG: nucleotidyl transferase AbiEii/AbiGii toxin family protein [Candidatus Rokuibacteriota bacterium]
MSDASLDSNAPALSLADAPDFEDLLRAAATYHGLLPTLVVKDYWVTRVLRAVAGDPALAGRVLFKGGTSLSKGWHLIDRFSEDIDLLLTGSDFWPMPGSRGARERQFKEVRARIEADTPLRLPDQATLSREAWNFYYLRSDKHCNLRYPLPGRQVTPRGPSADWLLVEAGYRGGVRPHAQRTLSSLVAEFVATQPAARAELEAYPADLAPFQMDLLKPERTFAEKLLALHVDMVSGVEGARRVRTRHYYDVAQLFARSEDVRASIASGEFRNLLREAVIVSNTHWGTAIDPQTLDLRASPALGPSADQARVLASQYESPAERALYHREWVPFTEIVRQLHGIREALGG